MSLTMTTVEVSEMSMDEAKAMGATALFGEKYGERVRVVQMGDLSTELCGGTHLPNTAGIGFFSLRGESSVAAGVRRVEAHVGMRVFEDTISRSTILNALSERFKARLPELVRRAEQLFSELREAHRELEKLHTEKTRHDMDTLLNSAHTVGGLKLITAVRPDASPDALRAAGDILRDGDPDVVAVLAGILENKLTFLAVCGPNAVARGARAGDLVRAISKAAGGSGGGRADSAMGGGKDISKVHEALGLAEALLEKATSC